MKQELTKASTVLEGIEFVAVLVGDCDEEGIDPRTLEIEVRACVPKEQAEDIGFNRIDELAGRVYYIVEEAVQTEVTNLLERELMQGRGRS